MSEENPFVPKTFEPPKESFSKITMPLDDEMRMLNQSKKLQIKEELD